MAADGGPLLAPLDSGQCFIVSRCLCVDWSCGVETSNVVERAVRYMLLSVDGQGDFAAYSSDPPSYHSDDAVRTVFRLRFHSLLKHMFLFILLLLL